MRRVFLGLLVIFQLLLCSQFVFSFFDGDGIHEIDGSTGTTDPSQVLGECDIPYSERMAYPEEYNFSCPNDDINRQTEELKVRRDFVRTVFVFLAIIIFILVLYFLFFRRL